MSQLWSQTDSRYSVPKKSVRQVKVGPQCDDCKEKEDKLFVLEMELDLKNHEIEQQALQISKLQKKVHERDDLLDKSKNKVEQFSLGRY